MPIATEVYTNASVGTTHTRRRISWRALLAGVVLAFAIGILLEMLGIAVGLGMVDVQLGSTPDFGSYATGAGIWWLVSDLIALFLGGCAAARLAGVDRRFDGMLHGLLVWAIATLVGLYILASAAGGLIGGAFSTLTHTLSNAVGGIATTVPKAIPAGGLSPAMLQDQAKGFLQPPSDLSTMSAQDAQKEVAASLATYVAGGADAPAARERIIAIMAAQMKITPEEATKRFDDAQAKLKQARDSAAQAAKRAADESARVASDAAYVGFAVLLLGAISAGIGGSIPRDRRYETTL